jgi:hypothetical protein
MKSIEKYAFRFVVLVLLCFMIWQNNENYKGIVEIKTEQDSMKAHSKFMDRHHYNICDWNGIDEEGVN